MKWISAMMLLCFCLSCQSDKKDEITSLVNTWQNKEIIFPLQTIFTTYANDTVNTPLSGGYKVLIYVDSVGCTSCKLQLPKWKQLIAHVDSIAEEQIPFYFFIHSKSVEETRYILKRENFDLPVCIDEYDQLNKLNQFPSDIMFQTFLLDKDNKVVVIGNPIHNLLIRDLYLKQITGTERVSVHFTTLLINKLEYDFGSVTAGTTREQLVEIRNIGDEPFEIEGVSFSCDCTEAFYDWKTIPAGESREIQIRYKAEQSGDFLRTVTIYGNMIEKSITLTFTGIVK